MISVRLLVIVGVIAALALLHWDTYASMVGSWISNTTYNHGFAIPFIALYFAWQRREEALRTPASVWRPGFLAVAGLSLIWSVGDLINVQVVAQFASVGLIGAIVVSLAGVRQGALFALPLAYLLFMVPFGQGIVPLLMDWTAEFTVGALHLVGIPVIRDGLYFSIPSGNFEVAEACSGVRYLLASAAAGVAFAFLTYTSWQKRGLFILAAILVPIVANGLRAFGIVLIAHYSDMRLATGVDHFIYGWFFFGIIIFLLFLVGSRFADRPVPPQRREPGDAIAREEGSGNAALGGAAGVALLLIAGGSALVGYRTHAVTEPRPALPDSRVIAGDYSGPQPAEVDWQLGYKGADALADGAYGGSGRRVELRIAAYGDQEQGEELINSTNRIAGEEWRIIGNGTVATGLEPVPMVRVSHIARGRQAYLVWYWYQQGSRVTTSPYEAKWLEMLAVFRPSPAAVVAIAAADEDADAHAALSAFLSAAGGVLRDCAAGGNPESDCVAPDPGARAVELR